MQKIYKPIQISNKITEILIGTCAECRSRVLNIFYNFNNSSNKGCARYY